MRFRDGCSVTVAQWLSADSGAAGAFQRMLGARLVPDSFWPVRRPGLRHGVDVKQPLSTTLIMRIWCCIPSGMMN